MPFPTSFARIALVLLVTSLVTSSLGMSCKKHEPFGHQTFTSPQVDPIALSADGSRLYVASTTSNLVDVIDTATQQVLAQVPVGLEPVSVAVRPSANEVWVSNHVSDNVSVIDTNPASPTFHHVVQTVQEFANGVTLFDEPTGIAFTGDGSKAYVALSAQNDIAVIDATTYTVTKRVHIDSQEPRAIAVRQLGGSDYLFVAAFESFNQSELSACPDGGSPPQCTLDVDDLVDFVVESPNIPGADSRIVKDPQIPDRDLYVFETGGETQVDVVDAVGTLLYGIAVDSGGKVFVTQADARNDVNGDFGDNLIDLDNRMFLNRITEINCSGGSCGSPSFHDLEPAPPSQPALDDALATPYGIAISGDDSTLVVTAMGTSRVFTVNASSGAVLNILDLDAGVPADSGKQIPRGVALRSDGAGAPETAYVLNSLENTVSVVDVSVPTALVHLAKISVGNDPTPAAVREGRIAFMSGFASTSGTFSCESCHPDSNTDQLLWRIGGPCSLQGCTGDDEIRSTMPVRGLKNTLPLHWDGTLGDPFGGGNGDVGFNGNGGTDCNLGGPDGDHDCFLDLVKGSLSGVMCEQDQQGQNFSCDLTGPSGDDGNLTTQERDDMATFLASVAYPPPPGRPIDDVVTTQAMDGFSEFFVQQAGTLGSFVGVLSCADMNSGCHALPLGVDTNSSTLGGFDVPTMRGMTDRTLQFSIGITNTEETLVFAETPGPITIPGLPFPFTPPPAEFPWNPSAADVGGGEDPTLVGYEELVTYSAAFLIFNPVYGATAANTFRMFQEASTGLSGAVGRQVTLNTSSTTGGALADTEMVMNALESADTDGLVNLRAVGVRNSSAVILSFRGGAYKNPDASIALTHADMLSEAQAGTLVVMLTGGLRQNVAEASPQPLLSVLTTADGTTGNPDLPFLTSNQTIPLLGVDVEELAQVVVDGVVDGGATLVCQDGVTAGVCNANEVRITLSALPANGLHLVQVQNEAGLLSNELPICVGSIGDCR